MQTKQPEAYSKQAIRAIASHYGFTAQITDIKTISQNGFIYEIYKDQEMILMGHAIRYSPSAQTHANEKKFKEISLLLSTRSHIDYDDIRKNSSPLLRTIIGIKRDILSFYEARRAQTNSDLITAIERARIEADRLRLKIRALESQL